MSDPNEPVGPTGSGDESAPPPPPPGDSPYGVAGGAEPGGTEPGGHGAPPPPPYGQTAQDPYGGSGAYSPTEALSYGWRKFSASPATLLVPMIVVWVGIVVVTLIVEFALVRTMTGGGFTGQLLVSGLSSALIFLVYQLLVAGLYRGALRVADGQTFGLGQLFEGWDKTQVVIASVLIALGVGIGTILCYLPGLIIGFLTQFTLLFVVDRQLQAVDAIKASVKLVTDNLGNTIVYYLLAAIVTLVGACLCGVGLLVAVPVVLIGYAYTYRRLQNQPVAP
jgi:hypothetical protein